MKIFFLTSQAVFERLQEQTHQKNLIHCATLNELNTKMESHVCSLDSTHLLSFGTSEIIPRKLLNRFKSCINIHAASPEFPGRDPHHFAIYKNVKNYGAVAHFMESTVDSGAIIDYKSFEITAGMTAIDLLTQANNLGQDLAVSIIERISKSEKIQPLDLAWNRTKTKRQDLIDASKIDPHISLEEFQNKYKAFQEGVNHKNLYIDLHGYRFRFEGKMQN